MNRWYREHRDGSGLQHADWNAFRDPDELVYRTYTMLQDGQETYVFGLFDQFDEREHDESLDPAWVDAARRGVHADALPLPHAADGLGVPAADVAGEHDHELRRVPGRRLDALAEPHRVPHEGAAAHVPDRGFGTGERALWEQHPRGRGSAS